MTFTRDELRRYGRHISLAEIGLAGQERLKQGRILVVGAGGLGCPALLYLAAAGVGTIGIVDFDVVEESNLQRQVLYGSATLGRQKAAAACERLADLNSTLNLREHAERLSADNASMLAADYDLLIDCSDNFGARYLINDVCVELNKPFVYGSIYRFEGQVSVFNLTGSDGRRGPTYRCLFPTPPPPDAVPSCAELGVLGVLPGLIGTLQAGEALKILLQLGEPLSGRLLIVNALDLSFRSLRIQRSATAAQARVLPPESYAEICGAGDTAVKSLTLAEVRQRSSEGEELLLVDVREDYERSTDELGGRPLPLHLLLNEVDRLPRDRPVVFYCQWGRRSLRAVQRLQDEFGFTNLYNLRGGLEGK